MLPQSREQERTLRHKSPLFSYMGMSLLQDSWPSGLAEVSQPSTCGLEACAYVFLKSQQWVVAWIVQTYTGRLSHARAPASFGQHPQAQAKQPLWSCTGGICSTLVQDLLLL